MKYIELNYPSLHIEFDYGDKDWETGRGTREFDRDIEYTYKVDKPSVEEVILNLLSEDEYDKIIKKYSASRNQMDETDIAYTYIEANFDDLFNRFEDEILDYFEQEAAEEAAQTIDPENYDYNPFDESLEMDEATTGKWNRDLQDKLNFLKNHKTHEGKFSRDVKVWDLDLTPEQRDYFSDFLESGFLEYFWDENKDLAKDIYQEGRSMGHLVLDKDYGEDIPREYDPFAFKYDTLDDAFEAWVGYEYDLYPEEYNNDEEFMDKVRAEFTTWLNNAYNTVVDFDDRAEKLVELFKQNLDDFIEQEKAPSDDLTETMFSEVEDIEEPELGGPKYDEINESYFNDDSTYFVQNSRHETIGVFGDSVAAINYAKDHFRDRDASFVVRSFSIWDDEESETPDEVIWNVDKALEQGELGYEDDLDECFDNALDELPELKESTFYNPDFDDDFSGYSYNDAKTYQARREWDDEEAFEERDPERYDGKHAKEWMKKHPHGWYNSESDYGVGDEEDEGPEEPLYEDLNGQILEFNNGTYFYVQKKGNSLIAGNATNTGIIPEFEIEYDENKSEDENLQDLYDIIIEEHPEFLEENYQCSHNSLNTLEEKYFNYNKYKLPHDVVDFIVKTAEKDIDERLHFNNYDWSMMNSSDTSEWVMDRIEIKFPGWKWTDKNMSYVVAVVDDVFDDLRRESFNESYEDILTVGQQIDLINRVKGDRKAVDFVIKYADLDEGDSEDIEEVVSNGNYNYYFGLDTIVRDITIEGIKKYLDSKGNSNLNEAAMSDLDIEIQETGYDKLIDEIQRNISALEREEKFLTNQAPREINKGGNFDSQEEITSALKATLRELNREKAKLAIVRGKQNG